MILTLYDSTYYDTDANFFKYLENYAIILIEMVTYPFDPTECLLFIECPIVDFLTVS